MSDIEILSLVVTIVCLVSFSATFTILFRHYYLSAIDEVKKGSRDLELLENAVYEEAAKKSKKKKALRLTGKILSWALLGVVILGFGVSLYARIGGNVMMFGDSSWIVIASGSMQERNGNNQYLFENNLTNQFSTYDVIELKKYSSSNEVALYDVVAYKALDERVIVHRIREIRQDEDGLPLYITRGDSNAGDDTGSLYYGGLHYEDLIGHYTDRKIPAVGSFVVFLQSNSGIITIAAIVYCLVMFDFFKNKFDKAVTERSEKLVALLEYDLSTSQEEKARVTYLERLLYKGREYLFEDGALPIEEGEDTKDSENPNSEKTATNPPSSDTIEEEDKNNANSGKEKTSLRERLKKLFKNKGTEE